MSRFLTRRDVLRGTCQALAGAAAVARTAPSLHRIIVVRLRGGADGLSILPPHGDPGYYPARPGIAMPPPGRGARAAIDLDGFFGLHPALAPLVPLFRAREVDVWPACRVPGATTSHLRADLALDELLAELRAEPVAPAAVPLDGAPASPFGCALGGLRTRLERADDALVLVVE